MSAFIQGGGDVFGPAGAIDGNLAVYNGTSGKILGSLPRIDAMPVGSVVQTVSAVLTTPDTVLNAVVPLPFTITDGTQFMSQGITPSFANSKILITFSGVGSIYKTPGQAIVVIGLFITGTSSVLVGVPQGGYAENVVGIIHNFSFTYMHTPGSGGLKTYTLRGGCGSASTQFFMNAYGYSGYAPKSTLTLQEIKQ